MARKYLETVYSARSAEEVRGLYDDWSATYDAEVVGENGYATPARLARMLAGCMDPGEPVLDFGCGTGVSGEALSAAGFACIDGCDISPEMLARAESKGIYRRLDLIAPDEALPTKPGSHCAITAIGVIGVGAAPVSAFDLCMRALAPGGLFAFSYNDHALEDPVHLDKLRSYSGEGRARELASSFGDHLPGLGSKSMIWVIEKL